MNIQKQGKIMAVGLMALIMALVLAACGDDPTPTSAPAPTQADFIGDLYEKARAEGLVVILTNSDVYTRAAKRGFNQRYPGIEVGLETGSPTERAAKVIAMERAGRFTVDLMFGSGRDVEPVVSRGLTLGADDIDWATLGYPPELVLGEGHLPLHTDFVYAHVYNTDLVDPSDLPDTLEGFADPKWKGRIVSSPFLYPAGMAFVALASSEEEGVALAKKVFDEADITLSNSYTELVENGEFAINLFSSIGNAVLGQRRGANTDFFFTPNMGTARLGMVILKDAPHSNAAKLFVHWLSTEEGRAAMFDENANGLVAAPFDTYFTKVAEDQNVQLVLENDSNWRERARLTGVVREAVVGQ